MAIHPMSMRPVVVGLIGALIAVPVGCTGEPESAQTVEDAGEGTSSERSSDDEADESTDASQPPGTPSDHPAAESQPSGAPDDQPSGAPDDQPSSGGAGGSNPPANDPADDPSGGSRGAFGGNAGEAGNEEAPSPTDSGIPEARRTDWNPGIEGGIPQRSDICATVSSEIGDGSTDATDAIQSALDSCPEGQVVELPAGDYRITGTLRLPTGVVLRGAGPGATHILLDDATVASALQGGGQGPNGAPGVSVESGFEKGSTDLTLTDASGFEPGDLVLLDQVDDPDFVATGDCTFFKRSDGGYRSVGQVFLIESKDGNRLTTSTPLHYDYSAEFAPQLSQVNASGSVHQVGVEDLYVTRTSDYGGQGFLIYLASATHSWVKNVETERVSGRHIGLESCYRCVVRDSYVHDAWNNNPGGTAYGIALDRHTSDSLVENNVVMLLNIPVELAVSGGGNVIAYNYVDDAILADNTEWQMADISTHCSFPHMELLEGNYTGQFASDNVHGGAGMITLYRNHLSGHHRSLQHSGNVLALNLAANSLNMNVVGNVLWQPDTRGAYETECDGEPALYRLGSDLEPGSRCPLDPRVKETLLRHGNFDFISSAVEWDEGIPQRDLPASLYRVTKPPFFGDHRWPPVQPDSDTPLGVLPAKVRFETELLAP